MKINAGCSMISLSVLSGKLHTNLLGISKRTREDTVPTISMFYGILIRMFFRDIEKHHVPHIHAEYQGEAAVLLHS